MEPSNPYRVTPEEIERLSVIGFVRLVNQLIADEAFRLHLPVHAIRMTMRITQGDEGADAETVRSTPPDPLARGDLVITDSGEGSGDYIHHGITVWQFKKSWPGPSDLKKELAKAAPQDAFSQGGGYTLVVGTGMVPAQQRRHAKKLEDLARAAGCNGPVRLLTADHLADWASTVPATVFDLKPQLREFTRADVFLSQAPLHQQQFEADELREATIDAIQRSLFAEPSNVTSVRIQGVAGVGKTRLALELLKAAGIASLALYAPNVPSSNELFNWMIQNPRVQATLVVDECDEGQALRLETWAQICAGRLRLITVGVGTGGGPGVYAIDPLDLKAIERVVQSVAPTLTNEQAQWIAGRTLGFVKLAVAVARAVARGDTDISRLQNDRQVRDGIVQLLAEGTDALRALQGVALLTRLGYRDQVAAEGRAVAAFMSIEWSAMRHEINAATARGIVSVRGRFWYVTPELLAIWLAAGVWEHQADRIQELLDALPSDESREALYNRLTQLGEFQSVRDILDDLLGTSGPFRDLTHVESPEGARLFLALARGAPEAAVRTLQRLIGNVPTERLREFREGRREVVWALETIVPHSSTFFDAARLLRRLAEAENESYGNSASGVWSKLFLTVVGPTEVPALDRLVLIEEALDDVSVATRKLAVDGLSEALRNSEYGLGIVESRWMPGPRWRPQTVGDFVAAKRAAIDLLTRATQDASQEVRQHARHAFAERARGLATLGLVDEVVQWIGATVPEDERERRMLWESVMGVLRYAEVALTDDQRRQLEQIRDRLYGESLVDRIKRYTGRFSHINWPADDAAGTQPEVIVKQLAKEAIDSPEQLEAIVAWLVSGEAENGWQFARWIGTFDEQRNWLQPLFECARSGADLRVLSAYLVGRAEIGDADLRENLLDEWAANEALVPLAWDATVRGTISTRAIRRALALVDAGLIPAGNLRWLEYGTWADEASADDLAEVLVRLTNDGQEAAVETGLALLIGWLRVPGHEIAGRLRDLTWQLIEQPVPAERSGRIPYDWELIARRLIREDPVRLARAAIRTYVEGSVIGSDPRLGMLEHALESAPHEVWPIIGEQLMRPNAYHLAWAFEEMRFLDRVPTEVIISWIEANGEDAAWAVAQGVKPVEPDLTPLARYLIEVYGSTVGNELAGNFMSGMWSGDEAPAIEAKRHITAVWQKDASPAVRAWANQMVEWLDQRLKTARDRDAERGL